MCRCCRTRTLFSLYKLNDEVLSTLVPDTEDPLGLIIAQEHCRVCAITPDDVNQSQALACSNGDVQQLTLKPSTLADCLGDIHKISAAMGGGGGWVVDRGIALCATLEKRMDRVRVLTRNLNQTKANTKTNKGPPPVVLLEWCDPIIGCGYWLPEIVEVAGNQALNCPPPGGATPTISFQTLLDSKPDVVIFALCGFGLSRDSYCTYSTL
jgi:iron complex transport system substrate-binding protein